MNRRAHHPTRRHPRPAKGAAESRPDRIAADQVGETRPVDTAPRRAPRRVEVTLEPSTPADIVVEGAVAEAAPDRGVDAAVQAVTDQPNADPAPTARRPETIAPPGDRRQPTNGDAASSSNSDHGSDAQSPGCTAPQLRRFIKSRAYVPMHELRRRFGIEGDDDEVTGVDVERDRRVYIGLPNREGLLLGELFRAGDVGYELSLDPISPIVVGVFPMRPIARG